MMYSMGQRAYGYLRTAWLREWDIHCGGSEFAGLHCLTPPITLILSNLIFDVCQKNFSIISEFVSHNY